MRPFEIKLSENNINKRYLDSNVEDQLYKFGTVIKQGDRELNNRIRAYLP